MQENVKSHRSSLLHKVISVVFLPVIVFIWTVGWTLITIGGPVGSKASSHGALRIDQKLVSHEKELEAPNEDAKAANEREIVA